MPDATPTTSESTTFSTSEPNVDVTTPIQNSQPPGGDGYESGAKGNDGEHSDDEGGCPFLDDCLWCFIVLIVLDVILVILLIILIILARRGSKNMKAAAMTKKRRKSETTVGSTVAASQIKSVKKNNSKSKKKSVSETKTTVGGKTDGNEVSKHGTEFYTVDSYFKTAPEKSKKKKGKK